MQYTKLGNTGISVSRICLGCMSYGGGDMPPWSMQRDWALDADQAREHFAIALESGINFFDTADVYSNGGSEEITGRWLGEIASRDDFVLATKLHGAMGPGPNKRGLSRKHVIEACENSLRRLKMDYIDLYQIHRWDFTTPIEETLDALDSLVRAGKVRYLGASSMAAWQFGKALSTAKEHGFCSDAKPLQFDLSRRRARDDSAVHRPRRRIDSVEPAGARFLRREPQAG
jgi:1-deoxyxylulose-5-phosphate synthase